MLEVVVVELVDFKAHDTLAWDVSVEVLMANPGDGHTSSCGDSSDMLTNPASVWISIQ